MVGKLFRRLEKYFEPVVIVALVSGMTMLIGVQIVLRLFGASMPEAEEIARYLFVWAMYLSISYAIRDNRHIRISAVIDRLPAALRLFLDNCVDINIFALLHRGGGIRLAAYPAQPGTRADCPRPPSGPLPPYTARSWSAPYSVFLRLSIRIARRTFGAGQKPRRARTRQARSALMVVAILFGAFAVPADHGRARRRGPGCGPSMLAILALPFLNIEFFVQGLVSGLDAFPLLAGAAVYPWPVI